MWFRRQVYVIDYPQPIACRANCISASADRRPVDPPPIVELRIFEGENADNEITFQLSANYFLFATLEQARPIAQGRVAQDPSRLTVLTGTPVAGMVYLDRPLPAGYFIFPDLSVRHEGKYRLSFNLYEELKEDKDDDQSEENGSSKARGVGDAHVTHRLEVKSQPFVVYSAKKFPGLKSSTTLSRTVAEQGCRVRIRRDVRMRKRDKAGKDWDAYEDETAYDRARQGATPDVYGHSSIMEPGQRSRSASITSHVSLAPASSRRPSAQEMAQIYSQGYSPQAIAGAQAPPTSYTQSPYGPPGSQHYQAQHPGQAPMMQATMPPPPAHMTSYNYPQQIPGGQQTYYGYGPIPQSYDSPPHTRNNSLEYASYMSHDHRRSSTASHQYMTTPQSSSYASSTGYGNQPPTAYTSHNPTSPTPVHPMPHHLLPPLNTAVQGVREKALEPSPTSPASLSGHYEMHKSNGAADVPPPMAKNIQPSSTKRSYEKVFSTQHMNGSLRQGARPGDNSSLAPHLGADVDDADDEFANLHALRMSYRRADGREIARPLPPSI